MLHLIVGIIIYFFFQAEDGIRDYKVTGVQTCALPISVNLDWTSSSRTKVVFDYLEEEGGALSDSDFDTTVSFDPIANHEIGRASCRERVDSWVEAGGVE